MIGMSWKSARKSARKSVELRAFQMCLIFSTVGCVGSSGFQSTGFVELSQDCGRAFFRTMAKFPTEAILILNCLAVAQPLAKNSNSAGIVTMFLKVSGMQASISGEARMKL